MVSVHNSVLPASYNDRFQRLSRPLRDPFLRFRPLQHHRLQSSGLILGYLNHNETAGLFFCLPGFGTIYAWQDDDHYICSMLILPEGKSYFNKAFFKDLKFNHLMERLFWLLKAPYSDPVPLKYSIQPGWSKYPADVAYTIILR